MTPVTDVKALDSNRDVPRLRREGQSWRPTTGALPQMQTGQDRQHLPPVWRVPPHWGQMLTVLPCLHLWHLTSGRSPTLPFPAANGARLGYFPSAFTSVTGVMREVSRRAFFLVVRKSNGTGAKCSAPPDGLRYLLLRSWEGRARRECEMRFSLTRQNDLEKHVGCEAGHLEFSNRCWLPCFPWRLKRVPFLANHLH